MGFRRVLLSLPAFLAAALVFAAEKADEEAVHLRAFADPGRQWGAGVERTIETAFRQCFKTYVIGEVIMNLRIPFAENHEREELSGTSWNIPGSGKSNPASLWPIIDAALASEDFKRYREALTDGKEKVVIFDIPKRTWTLSRDVFDIARMKAGSYHGLLHEPYVLVDGRQITESDVYNYLYCVVWAGMDCSAFVWHVLTSIAKTGSVNLGTRLRSALGAPKGRDPSVYAGTAFYGTPGREITAVRDQIKNLRPADIILFRAKDGTIAHSAIIQSIDNAAGVIRYVQNTDEAPLSERGPHESFIRYPPGQTNLRLTDPAVKWTQRRFSPFEGERLSTFVDDGERYRAYGGGRVVRVNVITEVINKNKRKR